MSYILLERNLPYLHLLHRGSPEQRRLLLASATPEQLHAVCEVCYNFTRGCVPISKQQKKAIAKHLDVLNDLADASTPFRQKKRLLAQQGGGLFEALVPPLISALPLFIP